MKSRRNDFALGLTTIVFLALLLGTFMFVYPSLGRSDNRIVIYFAHEQGVVPLKAGGQVMLSGALEVGTITDVRSEEVPDASAPAERGALMIVVEAEIREELQLYRDCKITTDQPMVGGPGFVSILNVGTPGEPLAAGTPIHGLAPRSLAAAVATLSDRLLATDGLVDKVEALLDQEREDSLTYKIAQSLSDINAMTAALRVQLDPQEQRTLIAKIHDMFDDVNAMTTALRAQTATDDAANMMAKLHVTLDRLTGMLSEVTLLVQENRPLLHSTLTSVESMARGLNEDVLAALRAELDRDDPESMLGKIHGSMDRLDASLVDVKALTGEGRRMLVTNRPAIDRTLANIKDTSEQLRRASVEIRLTPWRLLYKPTPRESDEFDLFEAARTFAEAATYLDDAAARLEAAVAATPAEEGSADAEAEIRAIQESVKNAFERFERAENFLWERMK